MNPAVSIIIPNYNHAQFLKRRINSVLEQTFPDFEIIILDDCSTDNSREIIESYRANPKVKKIIYNQANSGSPFKQWEKGIQQAAGKYIWIAESDDSCKTTFLESAIQHLQNKETFIHFCQSFNIDEDDNIIGDNYSWTESIPAINWRKPFIMNGKEFIQKALQYRNVIPNASAVVFLKTEINLNRYTKYKTAGDWLFWTDMLVSGGVSYSEDILNNFRSHSNTTRNARDGTTHRKFILRHYEILSVKFIVAEQYRLGDKSDVKAFLKVCIDISSIADLPFFIKFCNEFRLPKEFLGHFIIRKFLVNRYTNRLRSNKGFKQVKSLVKTEIGYK